MKDDSTCAEPKQGRKDAIIDHSLIVLRDQGVTVKTMKLPYGLVERLRYPYNNAAAVTLYIDYPVKR